MPERGTRESSVRNCVELRSRGKSLRRNMAAALITEPPDEPSGRPSLSRIERQRGSLSGSQTWLADGAAALDSRVLSALASDRDSPFYDSLFGMLLRALERAADPERWSERTGPVIVNYGRVRVGLFDWTTDRDAFIEALIGRQVPASPPYAQLGPMLPVWFASDFDVVRQLLGATVEDTIALFGMSGAAAARKVGPLDRVAAAMAGGDPVRADVQKALLRIDPDGYAATPAGRATLGVIRAAPQWRTPRMDLELAGAFDVGIAGRVGLAFWGGARELRSYRATMAAHLRYLFDYAVAPQNRWPDARTQREATTVWFLSRWAGLAEPGQSVTRPKIARHLRRVNPADYEGEAEAVTVRRLYRMSANLRTDARPTRN